MAALHQDSVGTDVIAEQTLALVALARSSDLGTPVPTCGGWTLADLVWHMNEVQDFWVAMIAGRPAGPEDYERPERPDDAALADALAGRCDQLLAALGSADPSDTAWSWSDDHTVGFTIRRQSHEALIHRVDGELAARSGLPAIDPLLAADGVDELLGVMLAGVPDWAEYRADGSTARIEAVDTGDRWQMSFGTMTGTSPDTSTTYELDAIELADVGEPVGDVTIRAAAADLDLWLWGRADSTPLEVSGDARLADRLRAMVVETTR